jgi:hypothetical protein
VRLIDFCTAGKWVFIVKIILNAKLSDKYTCISDRLLKFLSVTQQLCNEFGKNLNKIIISGNIQSIVGRERKIMGADLGRLIASKFLLSKPL